MASVLCVYSTLTYGDILGPLKIFRCKDYVEKFEEHTEDEVKSCCCTQHFHKNLRQNLLKMR